MTVIRSIALATVTLTSLLCAVTTGSPTSNDKIGVIAVSIVNLVCDGFVIDSLECIGPGTEPRCTKARRVKLEEPETSERPKIEDDFGGTYNHGGGKDVITKRYVRMGLNCSPKLPESCVTPIVDPVPVSAPGGEVVDAPAVSMLDNKDDDHVERSRCRCEVGSGFRRSQSSKQKAKQHHNDKDHNDYKKKKCKKPAHPYDDLFVNVGDFCGSDLYGCYFDPADRYHCEAVGWPPMLIEPDSNICNGVAILPCSCLSTYSTVAPYYPAPV
ncbi:hypothetical protein BGZ81_004220 [Podila clonocystis]|nr:hypothetical protein BGZ81_004220 [Podila clonocystis]